MKTSQEIIKLNFFGDDAEFDHVGLAVVSIKKKVSKSIKITEDETQKVSVGFADLHGLAIELIEPLGDESPVTTNLLNGQKLVHLCFSVPDLEEASSIARKNGFHSMTKATPAPAFNNRKIIWLFSRTFGLVELVEK